MKILRKKKVGTQRINYEIIFWDEDKPPSVSSDFRKIVEHHFKGHETFQSLSIKSQVDLIAIACIMMTLEQLRLSILSILNPEDAFKHNLELLVISKYFELYKSWLIEDCNKDNGKIGKQILPVLISRGHDFWEIITKFNC